MLFEKQICTTPWSFDGGSPFSNWKYQGVSPLGDLNLVSLDPYRSNYQRGKVIFSRFQKITETKYDLQFSGFTKFEESNSNILNYNRESTGYIFIKHM